MVIRSMAGRYMYRSTSACCNFTVRTSPSFYEQWQQTFSFILVNNISHISCPPPPPWSLLPNPQQSQLTSHVGINSMQGLCSGRWSASPTRYSAIDPGAALSLRLCLPHIERRTAPRGVHSTCPIPRGKNTRALTLVCGRDGGTALLFCICVCMYVFHLHHS